MKCYSISILLLLIILGVQFTDIFPEIAAYLLRLLSGLVLGVLLAGFISIELVLLLLPPYCKYHQEETSQPKPRKKPALQCWVNLLQAPYPSDLLDPENLKETRSARLTVDRNHLTLELPDKNIDRKMSKESKVPEDLNFYTLKTVLDLTFSRVQFQTDPQSEKVRFGVEVPIKIYNVCSDGREYLESVFYARGSREKEIIVNALKDGSHYIEDVKTKNSQGENDLNQFERDAWFHEFSVQCIYQHCNMETERGNYENEGFRLAEISNQPNKFLNAFFSRAFFDIRDSARLLEYLREKIHKKLKNVKILRFFPDFDISTPTLSKQSPEIISISKPEDSVRGVWFSIELISSGLTSGYFYPVRDGLEEKPNQAQSSLIKTFLAELRYRILRTISFRVELHYLRGEMIINLPNASDRIWCCFKQVPEFKLNIIPIFCGEDLIEDSSAFHQLIYRIIQVLESRVTTLLLKNLVYPNFEDIPVKFMESLPITNITEVSPEA
ncbi:uncharacterized protein LOC111698507 isoform X3 [Eurytemora carolleeae]|uniref:uncharacterized protein LOC111698507 isoform X3 n=1 Tax=Eurytemora carolleeae TaxID=1294199 RepID=UPI000C792268|nr:uncharacterized protein LOC111698507 isoform X3 [Eurytemora carolleeae]|eukprot:XP_023324631.1 uncharacterized protein LOC111698507 isoform X3 [Eurytemora affinis]